MAGKSELSFPIAIFLRVIVRNQDGLIDTLIELVMRHVSEVNAETVEVHPSRQGNYISVLLPMRLESKAQLDAVIGEISAHESVMMVL